MHERDLDERALEVLHFVRRFPGATQDDVLRNVNGGTMRKYEIVRDLIALGLIEDRADGRRHRYYPRGPMRETEGYNQIADPAPGPAKFVQIAVSNDRPQSIVALDTAGRVWFFKWDVMAWQEMPRTRVVA